MTEITIINDFIIQWKQSIIEEPGPEKYLKLTKICEKQAEEDILKRV